MCSAMTQASSPFHCWSQGKRVGDKALYLSQVSQLSLSLPSSFRSWFWCQCRTLTCWITCRRSWMGFSRSWVTMAKRFGKCEWVGGRIKQLPLTRLPLGAHDHIQLHILVTRTHPLLLPISFPMEEWRAHLPFSAQCPDKCRDVTQSRNGLTG